MSPELNGNPPVLIKRKKKRDKKHSSTSKINDQNPPPYNFLQGNNLQSYPNIAMNDSYFGFPNYSLPAEPVSLPLYHPPTYPNLHMLSLTHPAFNNKNLIPNEANEYMSLPVVNGEQVEQENSEQRRYSDPGLPNESDSSTNSHDSHLIHSLTQEVNILRENNRKLNREVHELRVELNLVKQQQVVRHSEREYEPGMITDMIREIRDAARVREDALLAKVKHIVEEKQFNMSQLHLTSEKNRNNERLLKIEDMIKTLNLNNSRSEDNISLPSTSVTYENNSSARQVIELENENLNLRRELQDVKARKDESDQKVLQLTSLLRPHKTVLEMSEDVRTLGSSTDTLSVTTQSSVMSMSNSPHRVTLSGPVTDL